VSDKVLYRELWEVRLTTSSLDDAYVVIADNVEEAARQATLIAEDQSTPNYPSKVLSTRRCLRFTLAKEGL
jgi:hypothetical protein